MAQRLEQPADAVVLLGGAEKHRDDITVLQVFGQAGVNFLGRRNDVLQELFQQGVVEIGQAFQQFGTGFFFPTLDSARNFNKFRRLAGSPLEGPFTDQVDMADIIRKLHLVVNDAIEARPDSQDYPSSV